ncbi:MAG: PDZ domain-containing protein [Verrucomicrobiales bacterium]|nr:PDZ domain-containing protein [Verrucomicrobiales bacterium]
MALSIIRQAALALILVTLSPLCADEAEKEVIIQWSPSNWTPAVPTTNDSWFIGVAPKSITLPEDTGVTLKVGGNEISSRIIHFDQSHRLCLIQSSSPISGLTVPELATFPLPGAGEKLHCWKPGSSCPTTVAGKEYSIRGEPLSSPLLRVRVADAEEFCHPGTPLVCGKGKLFGILAEVSSSVEGEAHAIPASCLHKLLTEFERYNRTGRVWVGLVFEDRAKTPQVVEVRPGSPADASGLLPGDVILSVGGHEVPDLDDLTQTIHLLTAGDAVEVVVLRGLKQMSLTLTPEFAEQVVAEAP